jgi:putative methionine-R-sulfoxide reductase with GAF domain
LQKILLKKQLWLYSYSIIWIILYRQIYKKVLDIMELNTKIIQIIDHDKSIEQKLQEICDVLKQSVTHYHWVGFYFVLANQKKLRLAQFAGKPNEHTIIPFGKGICGQVATQDLSALLIQGPS